MRERRCVYRVLVGKPEGKRTLGRPDVDGRIIFKMYVQEVGCLGMGWNGWHMIGIDGGRL
jgi:hypothetical protein